MEGVQMVMHLLIEELSVQVSWITTFMFLRLGHVHAHVTPPQYSIFGCNSSVYCDMREVGYTRKASDARDQVTCKH
jgi:hypothetical protein